MPRLRRLLACGLVVSGLGLATSGPALAGGGGGNSASQAPPSSGTAPATTSSSSTLSPSAPSGMSGTSSDPTGTLPYTGLDLWSCAGLGAGLLLAGVALRRVSALPADR